MTTKNLTLFIVPILIWGSTWFAIKFQLGNVDPLVSVVYRFGLAGIFFTIFCLVFKHSLQFSLKQHFFIVAQGISLFGVNYWLVYLAEESLTSGLVAVIFSLLMFFVVFFNTIFLKAPLKLVVLLGAIFGISGTMFLFKNEFTSFNLSNKNALGLLYAFLSIILASLGNIISAYNQKQKIPVLQTNALGMMYGAGLLLLIALFKGTRFSFDFSYGYIFSLMYLVIFGSIVAFTLYLKLLGRIGPDRSSYGILVIPLIAMLISTIFEGYVWQRSAIIGIILLIIGNCLALNKKFTFAIKLRK